MPSLSNHLILELGEADLNIFWFLKDFGWTLCLPHVYIPAAALAILLGACLLVGQMRWGSTAAPAVHTLAELMWVLGNSVWMMSEALYDDNAPELPWRFTPMIRPDKTFYDSGLLACLIILAIGALGLVGFYGSLIMQMCCGNHEGDEEMVLGFIPADVYPRCFILPWILKEMFWVKQMFFPGITCGALAFLVIADALRRSWKGMDRMAIMLACELIWNIGNMVWMWDEVYAEDKVNAARYFAATVFFLATVVMMPHTLIAAKVTGRVDDKPSEKTPVLEAGKGVPSGGGIFVADTQSSSSSP
jgi:hypothetical protein